MVDGTWNSGVFECLSGGRVKFLNRRIVEWWIGEARSRIVEWWSCRIVEWWNGGVTESSNGGIIVSPTRRIVEWWNNGVVNSSDCPVA